MSESRETASAPRGGGDRLGTQDRQLAERMQRTDMWLWEAGVRAEMTGQRRFFEKWGGAGVGAQDRRRKFGGQVENQ